MSLQRHDLRTPSAAAWREVLSGDWDEEARACLELWSKRGLPLVVTRQPATLAAGRIALGLPAPHAFGRRRLAIDCAIAECAAHEGFPLAADIAPLLADSMRAPWLSLVESLNGPARVYGSHGWQALTGLDHLHADSDIDLLLPVADEAEADAACETLATWCGPRLDGELVFADGAAVAWREWSKRRGSRGMLVKRTGGATIEQFA